MPAGPHQPVFSCPRPARCCPSSSLGGYPSFTPLYENAGYAVTSVVSVRKALGLGLTGIAMVAVPLGAGVGRNRLCPGTAAGSAARTGAAAREGKMNRDDSPGKSAGLTRRDVLRLALTVAAAAVGPAIGAEKPKALLRRAIPRSGELLPVIGMGSWLTFDVGSDAAARAVRLKVLQAFFDRGGAIVDSSPMYGSSEEVIGYCLKQIENKSALFAATKVWIYGQWLGKGRWKRRANCGACSAST